MVKTGKDYQDAECEEKQESCIDMATALQDQFVQMRDILDRIEGTNSDRVTDEDPGPGSLPLLEFKLRIALSDAAGITERLHELVNRI